MNRLSRRQRRIVVTCAAAIVFVLVTVALIRVASGPDRTYRPGEGVKGLTAGLDRSLPPDHPRVVFTDVTEAAGIGFHHFAGRRSSQLPEDMGSGAAWGDYNRDGWPDLYVVNAAGPLSLDENATRRSPARAALYRNEGDGTFTEVGEPAGVAFRGWGMGAAWGDYDNDGWPDLFVSAYGRNVLYRNEGDGTFTDRSAEAGIADAEGFWAGAAWGDYDRDGFLDLYVTGYVEYRSLQDAPRSLQYEVEVPASLNPAAFDPERNLLYHNQGDGTFHEVAWRAGVANPDGRGLGAVWSDFDEDGWPDLYVANDVSENAFFRNRGDGSFEDLSYRALVADYRGAMGLAAGDWDGDGDMDLFITHWIAQENALYTNLRTELARDGALDRLGIRFMDQTDRLGLGQIALDYIGWGTFFFDYDNDGRLDLLVVNGSTFERPERRELLVPMEDQLFWNRSTEEGFYDASPVSGEYFARAHVGRGAAFADYDGDGDLDLFIVNHAGPGILLRNDGGDRNRWLKVRLEGRRSNRSGFGARLRLVAGSRVQVRQVGAQASYLSQNSPVQHFGLGALHVVDTLEVVWPSGRRQRMTDVTVNRTLVLREGDRLP